MYDVTECPANEFFKQAAWRVSGPGFVRFFDCETEAKNFSNDLLAAHRAGELAAWRDANTLIAKYQTPESIVDRRLAEAATI